MKPITDIRERRDRAKVQAAMRGLAVKLTARGQNSDACNVALVNFVNGLEAARTCRDKDETMDVLAVALSNAAWIVSQYAKEYGEPIGVDGWNDIIYRGIELQSK